MCVIRLIDPTYSAYTYCIKDCILRLLDKDIDGDY
jgi:hypothetical protein